MTTKQFLTCAILALFCASCAGMTAAEVGTASAATVGGLAALIKAWADAGVLSPEQAAKWTATAAGIDGTVQAGLTAAQMVAESVTQVKAIIAANAAELVAVKERAADTFSKTETAGLVAGGAATGGYAVNVARNMARAKRGEPVGKAKG